MKIIMIRHGKVDMTWQKRYSTQTYDQDARVYDERSIVCEKQEKLPMAFICGY